MRIIAIVAAVLLVPGLAAAQSQAPVFSDVSPCHWAFDAVQRGAAAGVWTGYPTTVTAREQAGNAITQVYEGFRCRSTDWVSRFTTNRPAGWEQAVQAGRLRAFDVSGLVVTLGADAGAAAYTVRLALEGGQTRSVTARTTLRLVEGRWLVDYATLPPDLLR